MSTQAADLDEFLAPGRFVDSDSPLVRAFTAEVVGTATDPVVWAVRLFEAVRDRIWYDPFTASIDPAHYRASSVLETGRSWCVPKAVLLAAAARAAGIPARLGFADVRNHLQTPRLRERMGGSDVFVFHGYTELHLDGCWVKATPAFNAELCSRFGIAPITFSGYSDALLHEYDAAGGTYMEYVRERGVYLDLPLDEVIEALRAEYGATILDDPAGGPDDEFTAPQ